jgi:hypothetical protein
MVPTKLSLSVGSNFGIYYVNLCYVYDDGSAVLAYFKHITGLGSKIFILIKHTYCSCTMRIKLNLILGTCNVSGAFQ